jgi:hypothetical protein
MSGKLMGELFKRQLTQTQLVVALALADHAKDDGTDVLPGVGRVAWKVGKSPRQVQRIMRDLEALGLLVKVADAQQHRPTEYSMNVEALAAKSPHEKRDPRSQDGHPDVTPDQHVAPDQGRHPDVTLTVKKPLSEPPVLLQQRLMLT